MPRRRRRIRFRHVPRGYRWRRFRRAIDRGLFHRGRGRQAHHHHEAAASEEEARTQAEWIVRQAQQQAQAIVAAAAAEAAKISAQAERLSQEFVGRLSAVAGGDALDTPPPSSDDGSERVEAPPAQPSSP